jgi:hypothetical protein
MRLKKQSLCGEKYYTAQEGMPAVRSNLRVHIEGPKKNHFVAKNNCMTQEGLLRIQI